MLLTIDVGNTNTVLGVFEGTELLVHWRLTTRREQTADEYGILVRNLFSGSGLQPSDIEAVSLARSVQHGRAAGFVNAVFAKNFDSLRVRQSSPARAAM